LPQGAGGLPTLRIVCDFQGVINKGTEAGGVHRLRFEDANYRERIGWREIVIESANGVAVFDSTAFGSALTDELKAYPRDMLTAPLDERAAELSWTRGGVPSGAIALRTRDGRPAEQSRDRFAELISVKELTPLVALLGLLLAAGLGALHAMSPGHGKTVVGAYLVGSRGTAKHAAFLGMTVTLTHTSSVFALGLLTLFASHYVLPEKLFPFLSLVSGAIVLVIGLTLFIRRLRSAFGSEGRQHYSHEHGDGHTHTHAGVSTHDHGHEHQDVDGTLTHTHGESLTHSHSGTLTHSHGGREHSHVPPGADGRPLTWRSLLALGVSGGLLPCPSALVVMLSAISLGRVEYGLALILAFSVGLAATLTAVGLLFVYASRFVSSRRASEGRVVKALPVLSALVIACAGAAICYEALAQAGINLSALLGQAFAGGGVDGAGPSLASMGAFAVLGLGLVFGLKHATEVDHVVAVSTIVSEHRSLWRAAIVGGLWGAGHTASLVFVGVFVLTLRVAIPERVAGWLEFGVALMIIALGVNAFARALRGRADAHVHRHGHGGIEHAHVHFHEQGAEHAGEVAGYTQEVAGHTHAVTRIGLKPVLVGAMHGLAGSAALTLLVLAQIDSVVLGLLYLAVFGAGSILGMMLMSGLVGLPFALGSRRLGGVSYGLQVVVGALSIAFGLWYAYRTGISNGLM
jgi:ABC-type nickel/cobalt efflux system permease component RcnA